MVIKFKKGDDFSSKMKEFLVRNRINSGFFYGLGGFSEATIAFYDLKKKKYLKKKFKGSFEVLSISGNVAQGEEVVIHAHVVLGDKSFKTFGGHLMDAVVGGTLELKFSQTEMLERAHDDETGLDLLK